jgi:hypothetical protein
VAEGILGGVLGEEDEKPEKCWDARFVEQLMEGWRKAGLEM